MISHRFNRLQSQWQSIVNSGVTVLFMISFFLIGQSILGGNLSSKFFVLVNLHWENYLYSSHFGKCPMPILDLFLRSLFVFLSFFFWPLFCLSFDLHLLIIPLISSNFSSWNWIFCFRVGFHSYTTKSTIKNLISKLCVSCEFAKFEIMEGYNVDSMIVMNGS